MPSCDRAKCFKFPVDFGGTVGDALTTIRTTLGLPFGFDEPMLGYRWSYTYSLQVDGAGMELATPLAGVTAPGSRVSIAIQARRTDLLTKEVEESRQRIYMMTPEVMRKLVDLERRAADPQRRSKTSLRLSANLAFAHLSG
ncbi:MAG: hypothetical protein WBA45_12665 [Microthrixaceae bacterium]